MADNVCGTGGWTGPLPGDPDTTNISISAVTSYGGITVSWSYPLVNAHAVAHTILYRGLINDFAQASQRAVVAGSIFFDEIDPPNPTQYYYWIKIVSINGTVGGLIGPASALAIPRSDQTLESLTGLIDAGVLANSLKTEIGNITSLEQGLAAETLARTNANLALADVVAALEASNGAAFTMISNETTSRITADSAMVTASNLMAAAINNNAGLIVEEQVVRATQDEALAQSLTLLLADVEESAAAILTEANVRAAADSSLANQLTVAQSTLNNNIASVQTQLQTNINAVDGVVDQIGALWTTQVSVNGLIGGFGVYNNGAFVEAGFDVDRFWIGRTGPDKVKPFIIDDGVVYIDDARIRNADITTLKIAGNAVTIPVGNVVVDNATNSLTVNFDSPFEGVPVFIHIGVVGSGGTFVWGHITSYGTFQLGSETILSGARGYVGGTGVCSLGPNSVYVNTSGIPEGSMRRISILVQVIMR